MAGFDDAGVKPPAPHFLGHRERLKDRFVNGGPEVGADFSSLPFDHMIFTGATSELFDPTKAPGPTSVRLLFTPS